MASAGDSTEHIDLQLVALIRELEGIEELDPNAVAFLCSKIQTIRKSVVTQFQVNSKAVASAAEKKKLEKPSNLSLAEQKRKQYFF